MRISGLPFRMRRFILVVAISTRPLPIPFPGDLVVVDDALNEILCKYHISILIDSILAELARTSNHQKLAKTFLRRRATENKMGKNTS